MTTNFSLKNPCISLIQKLSVISMGIITIAVTGACSHINTSENTKTETVGMVSHTNTEVNGEVNGEVINKLKANLKKSNVDATVKSVEAIGDSGLYWVKAEDTPSFITNTGGKYVIQGHLIEIGGDKPVDVTSEFKRQLNKDTLNAVKIEDMIIFGANPTKHDKPKAIVYIFTDSTCHYCRKLHLEMNELNDLGIEVRYLASPRHPKDLATAEAIWCSEDRNQAMTDAKQDKIPPLKACNSPVVKQIELGDTLGIHGTPAVFDESGQELGGYLTPKQFAEVLNLE